MQEEKQTPPAHPPRTGRIRLSTEPGQSRRSGHRPCHPGVFPQACPAIPGAGRAGFLLLLRIRRGRSLRAILRHAALSGRPLTPPLFQSGRHPPQLLPPVRRPDRPLRRTLHRLLPGRAKLPLPDRTQQKSSHPDGGRHGLYP